MFDDKYGLTKAVLEGRKTMTRRIIPEKYSKWIDRLSKGVLVISEESVPADMSIEEFARQWSESGRIMIATHEEPETQIIGGWEDYIIATISRFQKDEEVAVAQRYYDIWMQSPDQINLTFADKYINESGWKNKMFVRADVMPHRIRITDIKVERLQDISKEDCLKEGIDEDFGDGNLLYWWSVPHEGISWEEYKKRSSELARHDYFGTPGDYFWDTPQGAFAALIDKISGKGTWKRNPWVFAYSFELVK